MSSCRNSVSAIDFITDFAAIYPLEGNVYYSSASKSSDGYISEELFRRIYSYDGQIPEDYAVVLNSRPERGAECGIFKVCSGTDIEAITELCMNRINLLSQRDNKGMVITSGEYVFYSTLDDQTRAKELFYRLIK